MGTIEPNLLGKCTAGRKNDEFLKLVRNIENAKRFGLIPMEIFASSIEGAEEKENIFNAKRKFFQKENNFFP